MPDNWSRFFDLTRYELRGRKSLWSSLVFITLLVYFTEARRGPWLVAFRYLYFLPITLAAYYHGRALGVAVSLLCTSLFLPILSHQLVTGGLSGATVEFIATLFLFNLWAWVAGTVGGMQRRERDFYLKLSQLGELLDQETKVDRLLSVSLEQSLRATEAEAGRILLHSREQGHLLALDSGDPGPRIISTTVSARPVVTSEANLAGLQPLDRWLMSHNTSLLSNHVQGDPRFLHPDGEGKLVHSLVAVPLRRGGKAIGLIIVVNSQDDPFDSQDLRLLEAISDRTAMAVERAWLYEAEQSKRRMADIMVEVSQIVNSTLDLDKVLNLVLDCLAGVVRYDSAAVAILVDGTLRYVLGRGPGSEQVVRFQGAEHLQTTQQILREKTPVVIADTRQYPGWVQLPGVGDVRSWIGAPMLTKDKVIGTLTVRKAEPHYYGPDDANVVSALASQVAIAIENARLFESERAQRGLAETLRETSEALASTLDLGQVLNLILDQLEKLIEYDSACILTLSDDQFMVAAIKGPDEVRALLGRSIPLDQLTLSRHVVLTREPLIVHDTQEGQLRRAGIFGQNRSWLGVPLLAHDQVTGALSVDKAEPGFYSQDDAQLAFAFANQAALAIENARLYVESRRRGEEMASLYEIGLATTSTLEPEQQLLTLHNQVQWLFAPDTFAIILYDPATQEMTVELTMEEGQRLPRFKVPLDEGGLTGWVIENCQALLVRDMLSEEDNLPARPKHGDRPALSWLGVPLVARGQVIGAMSVQSFQPRAFDEDDQRLLASIANQAAVAIENVRLLEAEHSRRRLADTLREVSQVVNSTLKLDEVLELILDELYKVIAYDSVSIQLLYGDTLKIISARGFEDPARVVGLGFPMDGDNPNHYVMQTKAPYIVPDTHAAYAAFREPPHCHIHSWLGVPLLAKGGAIGMIALDKKTVDYFSPDDAAVALTFANHVAMAIENARLYEETSLLAITDPMTGLFNSRYFYRELQGEILRSKRYGHPCSLIFFDIDDFKLYNDRYGHLAGDDLLAELGNILRETTRHPDTVARYGGEEFAIIQPETNQEKAMLSASRLWKRVREHEFSTGCHGRTGKITISIGVATYPQDAKSAKEVVHAADTALYVAKRKKDRVCTYRRVSR